MNRRKFIGVAGSSLALIRTPLGQVGAQAPGSISNQLNLEWSDSPSAFASPFDVADKTQLFVDKVLVRETQGVSFTLHPAEKHPANPLIKADRPWEGWRIVLYGSVLYDEDDQLFKMWYNSGDSAEFTVNANMSSTGSAVLYATSKDGIHWEKPLIGTIQAKTAKQHNAVLDNVDFPSVIKDKNDADPARRYKMITFVESGANRGYQTFISPDGLHWTPLSKAPIATGWDVISGYYDETRKLYVAYLKIGSTVRGFKRRVFYLITSKDFETWSAPELVWSPDFQDDAGSLGRVARWRSMLDVPDNPAIMRTEFYGIGAYPHESCTLAFPWVFTVNNNGRYGNQEGPFELQLGVSRDLKNWERPFRVPCLPPGSIEKHDWDCGLPVTAARALKVGDEVWLYYAGSNYTHGTPVLYPKSGGIGRGTKYTASIGLAKWKLDRFVSVGASRDGGILTTVPITFSGNKLIINAAVRSGGEITVCPLAADGQSLPGFGASLPFRGDGLRAEIRWPTGKNISELKGKPIVLMFNIKNASLYSYAFKG